VSPTADIVTDLIAGDAVGDPETEVVTEGDARVGLEAKDAPDDAVAAPAAAALPLVAAL
jgi:hypothetical protein